MSMTVLSNNELDLAMSLRASSKTPLPIEISLMDPKLASEFHDWMSYWSFFGLSEHPLIRHMADNRIRRGIAVGMGRASHLDRVMHYRASIDDAPVKVVVEDGGPPDVR